MRFAKIPGRDGPDLQIKVNEDESVALRKQAGQVGRIMHTHTHHAYVSYTHVGKGRVRRHENGAAVSANHHSGVRAVLVPGHVSAVIKAAVMQAVDTDRCEHLG